MDAIEWNRLHPPGTPVRVRLFNGRIIQTRTCSEAMRFGGLEHVQVEAIQPGYVLLSWCAPLDTERATTGESLCPT